MVHEPWVCGPCLAGHCAGCNIVQTQSAQADYGVVVCACPGCGPMWPTGVWAGAAGSTDMPTGQTLRDLAEHLAALRRTLAPAEQRALDALLLAALYPQWHEDFDAYWMHADGGPPWPPPPPSAPTPAVLQAFGHKLAAFRETLPTAEPPLLDTMIAVALRPAPHASVAAFWAVDSPVRPMSDAAWYRGDSAVRWATTVWGRAWRNA